MSFWSRLEQAAKEAKPSPAPLPPVREREEGTPMAILKREDLQTGPTATGDLLLGKGAEFEGKLTFAGTVRIDARFKGSITTNDVLVVGEHSKIDAEISCGTVIVHGEVNGNINARTAIEFRHPARVRGDIQTPSLMIEKGVLFQGQSKMTEPERSAPVKMVGANPPVGEPEGGSPGL
jgi:cytoskeletal protein CcmA (bactofilin family)